MSVSFVRRKFNAMLGIATITMSVNYLVMLSGSVIVGNFVGPEGLAGVNVCTPAFGIAAFIASLLSVGTGLVFAQAMGAFDEHRAAGVFSQSAGLALLCGFCICVTMMLAGSTFFDFMGVTGEVRRQAESYWRWQSLAMGLNPLVMLMEAMVMADGDGAAAAAGGACHAAGSIVVSIFLTRFMRTAGGASAGTAIAMILVLVVTGLHFFRNNNHLKFVRYWSKKDLVSTLTGSLPDASVYLCWAILIMAINKLVVMNYDVRLLAVVALAASVVQFSIIFDGVGEAIIPIGGMYEGERNWAALRQLANHSACVATLEGAFCGVAFYILAPVLAPLYGIRGTAADLLPQAIETMRILAFAMPSMGFLMMANTHYLIVHHEKFAVSVTFVKDFTLPCAFAFLMGQTQFTGIWWGVVVGFLCATTYPFIFVGLLHERRLFPWLIPPSGKILDFAVHLTKEGLIGARDRIGEFLRAGGVEKRVADRVMLTVEDAALETMARNKERRAIAEYAVFLDQKGFVRLVTRDTGKAFDVNTALPYLTAFAKCRYLNTLNCNRSEYFFKIGDTANGNHQ